MDIENNIELKSCLLNSPGIEAVVQKYPYKACEYAFSKYSQHPVLSKIIIPDKRELRDFQSFTKDPLGDKKNSVFNSVVQKYPSRLLLILNNKCAANCRYCNRKNFWKESVLFDNSCLNNLGEYIEKEGISEIILSGGDPFLHNLDALEDILDFFNKNDNIQIIRIHTKILSFFPELVLKERLLSVLKKYWRKLWIFNHFVHPDELCNQAQTAALELASSGIVLLNQNPVLKDINDSYTVLSNLFTKLLSVKIKPQYLFQLDPAQGTGHFYVEIEKTLSILKKMQGNLSGLAIPRFLVDLPDGFGKVPLSPNFLLKSDNCGYMFENYTGHKVFYPKSS